MKKLRLFIITFLTILLMFTGIVNADEYIPTALENDAEVQPDSELDYYLTVKYNGVDADGKNSENTGSTVDVYSDVIYVEDKIPEGLIFEGFVSTPSGSFDAVKMSDGASCSGSVIDDTKEPSATEGRWNADKTEYTYHGLHFTTSDNTFRCRIKNLQAGGKITIGIKTRTPHIDLSDTPEVEHRLDFYNVAEMVENSYKKFSNVIHSYMKDQDVPVFDVEYQYEGEVPPNVDLPGSASYAANTRVGVASSIKTSDYNFNGWTTTDATVTNGIFTMPSNKVILKGSFDKDNVQKFNVKYVIDGVKPEGYLEPTTKEYAPKSIVNVDSLKAGDVVYGYKFLGWNTSDTTVSSENDFEINNDVTFTGKFEQIKYLVQYKFRGDVIPSNSESLLPKNKTYAPGVMVNIEDEPKCDGYVFLGWNAKESFKMPEDTVTIYGEWMKVTGTFEPKIIKEVVSKKDVYKTGDVVEYKITVTNTSDFEINDVAVTENNIDSEFKESDKYTKENKNLVVVKSIAAGAKAEIYASYKITDNDVEKIINEVEIIYARASNDYVLADKEYKARCELKLNEEKEYEPVIVPVEKNDSETTVGGKEETTPNTTPNKEEKVEEKTETPTANETKPESKEESKTEKTETVKEEKTNTKVNVKTGDNIVKVVVVLAIAIGAFVVIRYKKKK